MSRTTCTTMMAANYVAPSAAPFGFLFECDPYPAVSNQICVRAAYSDPGGGILEFSVSFDGGSNWVKGTDPSFGVWCFNWSVYDQGGAHLVESSAGTSALDMGHTADPDRTYAYWSPMQATSLTGGVVIKISTRGSCYKQGDGATNTRVHLYGGITPATAGPTGYVISTSNLNDMNACGTEYTYTLA